MTHADPSDAPESCTLVCPTALQALADQVGSAAAALYLERFVRLWPERRHRLHLAVSHQDAEACRDAALSLVSSATLAGAHRLAGLGARLHADVPESADASAWSSAIGIVAELDRVGGESIADVARLARRI
ncbi:hypothetical protein GCM10009596_05940 [Arthrobacter rhombi]|uniref:hypothetical protein n=1 Tax=Arthrobacter rhombi TaxID=71253 RepID=UPI0031DA686C